MCVWVDNRIGGYVMCACMDEGVRNKLGQGTRGGSR